MDLISLLFGLILSFFGFFYANNPDFSAQDEERKNDINQIFASLEQHYSQYGEYPTESELLLNYDEKLPGLDSQALIDPSGKKIQEGDYKYLPENCSAIGCESYEIYSKLSDSSKYTKNSLN